MSLQDAPAAEPYEPKPDEPQPHDPKPYGPLGLVVSTVLILVATLTLCALLAGGTFLAAVAAIGWQHMLDRFNAFDPANVDAMLREKAGIAASLVVYTVLSVVVLVAARIRGGAGWQALIAWRPWHPLRGAAWIWGLAVLLMLYSLVADAAITHFVPSFNAIIHVPPGPRWAVLFVILAAVFAPVTEELLFRGWLYTSLRASFGVVTALIVVSVLFALAHWEDTHLYAAAVFPVGLGLAWVRERTGSIKASICVHGFYNGIASVLLIFTK